MTDYVIDLDERDWLAVPPGFPYLDWQDAETWAASIARAAVPDDPERRAAFERGALMETSGPSDEVVKLLPPLTTSRSDLETGLEILAASVAATV